METGKGKSYLLGLLSRTRVRAGEKGQATLHSINWSRKPQHDSFLMRNVSSELSRYSSLVEMKFIFLWLSGNCWEKIPLGKPQLQGWAFGKQKGNIDTWLLLDMKWYFMWTYPRLKYQVLFKTPLLGENFSSLGSKSQWGSSSIIEWMYQLLSSCSLAGKFCVSLAMWTAGKLPLIMNIS